MCLVQALTPQICPIETLGLNLQKKVLSYNNLQKCGPEIKFEGERGGSIPKVGTDSKNGHSKNIRRLNNGITKKHSGLD